MSCLSAGLDAEPSTIPCDKVCILCDVCRKLFANVESLEDHKEMEHNSNTMCGKCPMEKKHCICEWLDKAEEHERKKRQRSPTGDCDAPQ